MPQTVEQKRMDAIRRTINSYGGDYTQMPTNTKMGVRAAYLNLSTSGKATIAEEFKLKFGTGYLLWIK